MRKKEYSFPVTVEFEDVDSYKIAHHTKLIAYLERARVHFLTDLGFDLHPAGLNIVLFSLDIRFKKTTTLLDKLIVMVRVEAVDDYRLTLGYTIKRGEDLICRASSGIAFADITTGAIVPAPESYLAKIREYI
jgi:acyl-CoA thioester hydrolase